MKKMAAKHTDKNDATSPPLRATNHPAASLSRRRVVTVGGWTIPTVLALATVPAVAASSPQPAHCPALQPTSTRWPEASAQLIWVPGTQTVGGAAKTIPQQLIIRNDGNVPLPAGSIITIRSRLLATPSLATTNTPYATVAAIISGEAKPGLLQTRAEGYSSDWALICEIPVGFELPVNPQWNLPRDSNQQGQFVAAMKISAAPNSFFTVLTPELITG